MGEAKQTADEGGAGQVQNAGRGGLSTGEGQAKHPEGMMVELQTNK